VTSLGVEAEDLFQVYRDAQRYDAAYSSARQALEAGREKLPQGRALILPTLNLTGSATRSRFDVDTTDTTIAPAFTRSANNTAYTLTFTQPLYRPQNWLQYVSGEFQVRQAEAAFSLAYQDLVIRVSQAYFDALAAIDTLNLVRAQKAAISEQLAQAKRNFEVGTATITDTHEAQARFDLSSAQEIAAINDLESKQRVLQQLTGKVYTELKHIRPDIKLSPPSPANMESWVQLAEKQNYSVQQSEAAAEVARREAQRASAAHWPTLDIVGTYGQNTDSGSVTSAFGRDINTAQIGVQLALPLYQGGGLSSREREAAALSLKSKDDLENARRSAALSARQTYLAVINGIAQVGALEQALISSQSALDSNRLGYEVGVRINIDVLNAQQQLFSTRRDLAVARYNTITNQLRLKAAAGSLREEDVEEINRALAQ
jgi:outer membrane protein